MLLVENFAPLDIPTGATPLRFPVTGSMPAVPTKLAPMRLPMPLYMGRLDP